MSFQIKLKRNAGIPKDELLEDLKLVAEKLNKQGLLYIEYKKNSDKKFSKKPFKRIFGSWNNALTEAGLVSVIRDFSNEDLFNNLVSTWGKLGKQPSQNDLNDKSFSNFHSCNYKRRFSTYNNALKNFAKWLEADPEIIKELKINKNLNQEHKTKRDISIRLRYIIMKRDNFKCVAEWHPEGKPRSPAEDPNVVLHVDHIKAWANDGETVLENLQTLCSECNWAKSNLE